MDKEGRAMTLHLRGTNSARVGADPESIPRYAEYPAEMDPTPKECMLHCDHFGACSRLYEMLVDDTDTYGWQEDMALRFCCDECDEWYGKPW